MRSRFKIQQKITALVNRYEVVSPSDGKLLALAQQKRLALKESVKFYADNERTEEIFSFHAEKIADIHGRYFVEDANKQLLGGFRKEFKKSLLRSSWVIFDEHQKDIARIRESSQVYAVMRRVLGWVPIVGDIFELLGWLIKYHFELVSMTERPKRLGVYKKLTMVRDHYLLETEDQLDDVLDWRVLVSVSVALDALQSR